MAIISPPANIDYYESNETAIEDDDDEGAWENINCGSPSNCGSPGKKDDTTLFQRVDSRANLPQRRSLLSSMLERKPQNFQAATIIDEQQATSLGKNPTGHSPSPDSTRFGISGAQPIAIPIVISPHEVRINRMSKELPESLRLAIVWERSRAFPTANTVRGSQVSNVSWNIQKYTGDYNVSCW